MKRNKELEKWILGISVIALITLVIVLIFNVSDLQRDARVINYAGRARGATQRLIKQEISGYENDELIKDLDDILEELSTGVGYNNLSLLRDSNYQSKLKKQIELWEDLKKEIYNSRQNRNNLNELYYLSEEYYELADNTVDAAEIYSAESALLLKNLEIVIVIVSLLILFIILLMVCDILHLARINKSLNEIAYIDVLTGLPNRTYCELKIRETVILNNGQDICCFMFDLNNLKSTNDICGHTAGDTLIRSFAKVLKDSAPERMFIGRFGGDEFIGILSDTSEKEVQLYVDTLLDNVERFNKESEVVEISFAYGVAISSHYNETTVESLLVQADKKMYQHKAEMKNKST